MVSDRFEVLRQILLHLWCIAQGYSTPITQTDLTESDALDRQFEELKGGTKRFTKRTNQESSKVMHLW